MKHFIIALLFVSVVTVSCSNEKKLTFMPCGTDEEINYWEKVVSNFTVKTDIEVELLKFPGDPDQQKESLLIPLRARMRDPDVIMLYGDWIYSGIVEDSVESLDDYNLNTTPFFKRAMKLVNPEVVRYIPLDIETGAIYYRRDLLAKYGYSNPPLTWRELVKIAERIQKKERVSTPSFWGFLWQNSDDKAFLAASLEIIANNRGSVRYTNGSPVILSTNNMKALQFIVNLVLSNKISPTNAERMRLEEMRNMFQSGQALFIRDTTAMSGFYMPENQTSHDPVSITAIPSVAGGDRYTTMNGRFLALSSYSDMKDEALMFIAYLCSYGVQRDLILDLGWQPGRRDVYFDSKVLRRRPYYRQIAQIYGNKMLRPYIGAHPYIPNVVRKSFENAIAGRTTSWEALNSVQLRFMEFYQ